MILHIPAPVLERLAALASLDAQSEPHTEEVYTSLTAAAAAFLAVSNDPGAELTLVPVGIVWDERLLGEVAADRSRERQREEAYQHDPDGGLARLAADEWVDARCFAEGMEPFADGGGNYR